MKPVVLPRPAPYYSAPDHDRPWDRFAAQLRAPSLDRLLATGRSPQSTRALTIRARQLSSPAGRRELARHWTRILDLAVQLPVPRTPRAPLCRAAVVAAEAEVREMIAVLAGSLPIDARGAASAFSLLRDGTGPLHNSRSPLELSAAVQEATRQMG
jgi:hypothetical protein